MVDPSIVFARTQSEVPLVANLLSRGAVFQAGNSKNIPIVRGGVPPTDKQVLALLPGRLNFVLRWDGPANLDLLVGAVPAASSNFNGNASSANVGEALYPATGANFSASGGTIPFDHQGGKHGGFEIAYWPKNLPADLFAIGVNHTSGATVNYSLDVYLGRTPLLILDPAANGGLGAAVTHLTERIGAGQSGGGITVTRGPLPFPTLPGDLPPVISAAKAFPAAQVTKTPTRTVPAGELRMGSGVLKTQK